MTFSGEDLVLGVDLSTQSVKTEVRAVKSFKSCGISWSPLPHASAPNAEQHPHDWWDALVSSMGKLREKGVDTKRIRALAVAGQCHGLVALDDAKKVIRPAQLWNNTLGAPYIAELIERFGPRRWAEECGTVPPPAFTISKLCWLVHNEPESFSRLSMILMPHDYLNYRITGHFVTDRSEASGTGYYNSVANEWALDLLEDAFGPVKPWSELLPRVAEPEAVAGTVTTEAADILGLEAGIPVAPGGGDQHLAAVGLGIKPGDVCFSLGTSGVVFTVSDVPVADPTAMIDGVASVTGGWQPLVCTQNLTQVINLSAQLMGVAVEEIGDMALRADRSMERPVFAPFLGGERSPNYPTARGIIEGIKYGLTREDLALTIVEGILLGLVRGLEELKIQGIDVSGRVVAIGGAASSLGIRQILADLIRRPIHTLDVPEGTLRGAGLQALSIFTSRRLSALRDEYCPSWSKPVIPRSEPSWADLYPRYLKAVSHAGRSSGWGRS